MTTGLFTTAICFLMLTIKGHILFRVSQNFLVSYKLILFTPLFLMNLLELTQYFSVLHSLIALKLYYCLVLISTAGALYIGSYIIKDYKHLYKLFLAISLVLCFIIMFTNLIIEDFKPSGVAIAAIEGKWYSAWESVAITGLFTILFMIIQGIKSKNRLVKLKSICFAIAASSPIILGVTVIILMALGYEASAAIWLPICTSMFVYLSHVLIKEDYKYDLCRLLRPDIKTLIKRILEITKGNSHNIKNDSNLFKQVIAVNAYEDNDKNIKTASKAIKMGESTLRDKLNKHRKFLFKK